MRVAWRWAAAACLSLAFLSACRERGGETPAAGSVADSSLVARLGVRPVAGEVHLVRVLARAEGYAFEPREIRAAPGDVVRFVQTAYQPETITFDTTGLDPAAVRFLRDGGYLDGLLLVDPGQIYDISLQDAPPGRYPFLSRPHAGFGMRGVLVVDSAAG